MLSGCDTSSKEWHALSHTNRASSHREAQYSHTQTHSQLSAVLQLQVQLCFLNLSRARVRSATTHGRTSPLLAVRH